MTEPEQPAAPALTRKQLRQIRSTGATPIITPDGVTIVPPGAEVPANADPVTDAPAEQPAMVSVPASIAAHAASPAPAPAPAVPLARPAEPPVLPPPPVPDSAVDLGVAPLTRRQARQQERIRTASVPVITPEVAAAYSATSTPVAEPVESSVAEEPVVEAEVVAPTTDDVEIVEPVQDETSAEAPAAVEASGEADDQADTGMSWLVEATGTDEAADEPISAEAGAEQQSFSTATGERPAVSPALGAGLLSGTGPSTELPPSFDELITLSTSGSSSTPNALIVSQTDPVGIVAPVTATGEVLVTGSFNLPEGLGSTGTLPGTADGKEIDATLVDGELPAHSSPTPIAASAAVSTVKTPGEIIRPPAPEKGSRLMLSLAITAGVLALALVGVLILAFVTGVF